MLNCIDNSGALLVECAAIAGGRRRAARIGDRIVVVVQEQRPLDVVASMGSSAANKVKRGDVRQAIVVRTRYASNRRDGSVVRFGDNACVLVNKAGDPLGTRVNGVVGAELRKGRWSKLLSLTSMHI